MSGSKEEYSYETLTTHAPGYSPSYMDGKEYRIRNSKDDRIATCYDEGNAQLVVAALNNYVKS